MKPSDSNESMLKEILAGAEELGADLTLEMAATIRLHLGMVLAAAPKLNLTSITDLHEAVRLHVFDSLSVLPLIGTPRLLTDLGSGAGYPGIPLAVASGSVALLVESRAKRAAFLGEVAEAIGERGVDARVLHGRAEEAVVLAEAGSSDAVVARAVAPLSVLVELAAPFLAEGGRFVAMKGEPDRDELERGDAAATIVGLERSEDARVALPGGPERRRLIVYTKMRPSSVRLPRRVGVASKRPLA